MSVAALPKAYTPFQDVFEKLSDGLCEAVTGQLAQMEPLVRLIDEPIVSPWGELQGLGGLTRNGELANILQSELLLRTEAPLEFLRRVAEGETLYHEREYSDDGSQRIMRLMLSVGPTMLGHGRVFSTAALFVFARIAAHREEALHWCFLPNPKGAVWFDGLTPNSLKRFFKTASFREMTGEDADAANALWAQLNGKETHVAHRETVDWIVGAQPVDGTKNRSDVLSNAPRAIVLRLHPPKRDTPRTAEIVVRRSGRTYRPMAFTFPANPVCLTALNRPFAQPKVGNANTAPPILAQGKMQSWAPRYITAPTAKAKIVRMADGVLIVKDLQADGFGSRFFIPIGAQQQLAGIQLRAAEVSILLQETMGGIEKLTFHKFVLNNFGRTMWCAQQFEKTMPCSQLFRGHPSYALPILAGKTNTITFHAANGKCFSLIEDAEHDTQFKTDRKIPNLLYAEGRHRIVQDRVGDTYFASVLDSNNINSSVFILGDKGIDRGRLRAMLYSNSEGHLAYSLQSNHWIIPSQRVNYQHLASPDDAIALECELASYEIPMLFRRDGDDIHVTIRSEASLGGEGCVRKLHFRHGTIIGSPKLCVLGAEAANTCHALVADDGIWAVFGDAEGTPETLVQYPKKARRDFAGPRIYSLAELRDDAVVIETGV